MATERQREAARRNIRKAQAARRGGGSRGGGRGRGRSHGNNGNGRGGSM